MPDQPMEMIDVEIVLTAEAAEDDAAAAAVIAALGVEIDGINADEGVVEATLRADLLATVKGLPVVAYVRTVFSYIAEPPPPPEAGLV
ncbi:MAG TPA: hypothetical protein VF796_20105 [Humisphaera sp.]